MKQEILKALAWRYATKIFDPAKKITTEDLHTILESGRLSPSAIGLEPWKFLVVENPALREKLRVAAYGQPKVTDAAVLIVFARRTDVREHIAQELLDRAAAQQHVSLESLEGLRNMAEGGIAAKNDVELQAWIRSQVYIPLGIMIQTASLLEIDNCPMEGFNPTAVDEILGLTAQNLASVCMLALGGRGADPAAARQKVRRPFEEVVQFLK
ncbi:NAD(P)H-dependent oxidoreductase [Patescibacteria group bacterium]|nr:NAD(P)H-dependent oxidoreductase [Patescibacteria group bacterium]